MKRYASSISSDLVHAISKGKFLTEKHVLLGTGLHSLTGQKVPIKLLGKFGHSINYDNVRMIETAQAEMVQQLRSLHNPLPLLPATELDRVITFFWWDNFDCNKENTVGSLQTTHDIAYQEESTNSIEQENNFQVEKSSRRSVSVTPLDLDKRKIFRHINPGLIEDSQTMEIDRSNADKMLLIWQLMRRVCSAPEDSKICWMDCASIWKTKFKTYKNYFPSANQATDNGIQHCDRVHSSVAKAFTGCKHEIHTHII